MSSAPENTFTPEEIAQQATGNVTSLILVTLAYFGEHDTPADDWITFVGRRYAVGWEELKGQSAQVVARAAALNLVSGGGELRSLSGDDAHAEAVISHWVTGEELQFFGLSQVDADHFMDVFHPIAEYLGLRYSWRRQADDVILSFSR